MTTPTSSPNYRTGKICYIEIPAIDIAESAQFYQQVFGWHTRQRSDGSIAFDDTIGEVSGTWVLGRPPRLIQAWQISRHIFQLLTDKVKGNHVKRTAPTGVRRSL